MNDFDLTVDEITLGCLEALKEPEIEFYQREFAVKILEASFNYLKRRIVHADSELLGIS